MIATAGNIEAIVHYSCSIHDLLALAKRTGNIEPIIKAAGIDVAVLSLPGVIALLRTLQMGQMHDKLGAILATVAKGPHRRRIQYPKLRWVEYLLRHGKAFETCTQDEIATLIIDDLHLYGDDHEHKDAKKALFAMFRKWQREAAN